MKDEARDRKEYKADFLWPHEDGSLEQLGYEFANAQTEEYRKEIWNAIVERTKSVGKPDSDTSGGLHLADVSVSELDIKAMFPYEDIEEARPTRPLERIMKYNARQEDRREGARILLARIHLR